MQNELEQINHEVLQMGWLLPNSPLAQELFPDMAGQARQEGWSNKQFQDQALLRLPLWVGATLSLRESSLIDDITQNFVVCMNTRRPDLYFNPEKGTRVKQLRGILRRAQSVTWRQHNIEAYREQQHRNSAERRMQSNGDATACPARFTSRLLPLEQQADKVQEMQECPMERKELLIKAKQLLKGCSRREAAAIWIMCHEVKGKPIVQGDKRKAFRMQCHHALKKMRQRAEAMGLRAADANRGRRRLGHVRRRRVNRSLVWPQAANRLRGALSCGKMNDPTVNMDLKMAAAQKCLEEKNARALQSLFDSLPSSLKERTDVLSAVRDTFEREFARHLRRRRHTFVADASDDDTA